MSRRKRRWLRTDPTRLARGLGQALDKTVASLGKAATGLVLPTRFKKPKPGTMPGIEHHEIKAQPGSDEPVFITCIDYRAEQVQTQHITDIDDFLGRHRPEWSAVRWINVDGLRNMAVIEALARKYELHPLAVEDLLHVPQRPKVDAYGGGVAPGAVAAEAGGAPGAGELRARLFIICRMLQLHDEHLHSEQISIFLGHKTVLTFQETHGDVWNPIRQRIGVMGSRLRLNDASFLAYSLIDAIVDHCFPILEHYGDRLEDLEDLVLGRPDPDTVHEVHNLKRELLLLRRAVWPMREVVHTLQREPHECMSDNTRTYLRDVYDHTVQVIDIIETYREVATGLTETYMTSMSNRMNEVMKVLTIIGTIFIPLTFLAGVYGMNFQRMPEIHDGWGYPWAYPLGFWGLCGVIATGLLIWFRRRKWL